jgi:hypothetical protein
MNKKLSSLKLHVYGQINDTSKTANSYFGSQFYWWEFCGLKSFGFLQRLYNQRALNVLFQFESLWSKWRLSYYFVTAENIHGICLLYVAALTVLTRYTVDFDQTTIKSWVNNTEILSCSFRPTQIGLIPSWITWIAIFNRNKCMRTDQVSTFIYSISIAARPMGFCETAFWPWILLHAEHRLLLVT